jgi:hypothetical protein
MQLYIKIILFILVVSLTFLSNSISRQQDYVQGELFVTLNDNLFDFPIDVYAAYISFSDVLPKIILDSVVTLVFKPRSRIVEQENIISFEYLSKNNPELSSQLNIHFPIEFIELLKTIDAYWIGRSIKAFSWSDSLLHPVTTKMHPIRGRIRTKQIKSPNFGKYLTIKYKAKMDALEICKELKNLSCIHDAYVNQIFIEDHIEKPSITYKKVPILPDSIEADTGSNIVVISVLIDTLGNAEEVFLFSSRDKRLNPFALNCAKECKFTPARRNGKKIKWKMNVKFTFN